MEKIYRILEDPMLPPQVGQGFQEFTLLLDMDKDYMVPGDIVVLDKGYEYQAIIQYLGQEYKNGLKHGYYYTMQLITRDEHYFIPSKLLQKNCEIKHIGAAYAS